MSMGSSSGGAAQTRRRLFNFVAQDGRFFEILGFNRLGEPLLKKFEPIGEIPVLTKRFGNFADMAGAFVHRFDQAFKRFRKGFIAFGATEPAGFFERSNGGFRERVPVTHGGDGDGIDVGLKSGDEFHSLALGEYADRGAAADHGVTLGNGNAALPRDVAGQRAANEIDRAEGDDVGIEEEIAKEGFDGVEGIRAAQLKEDDSDAFSVVGGQRCFLLQVEIAAASGDHRL